MVVYRGTLNDSHLLAVIRVALRARGFSVSLSELERTIEQRQRLGCWIRDQALPERFPGLFRAADRQAVAEGDPYLWGRLPLMAGFGFQQAAVLHGLAPLGPEVDSAVALLGATFNSAIAVFDYLIDECRLGTVVFEVLRPEVVRGIFEAAEHTAAALAAAHERLADPRLRLLLALVAAWAADARTLHRHSGNDQAWAGLGELVVRLYEAERAVSLGTTAAAQSTAGLLAALETKSVLPSLAVLQISTLASQRSEAAASSRRAALVLGQTCWFIDDLVDLLRDYWLGAPSALLGRLADRLAAQGRAWASDTDLYDAIDAEAAALIELLQPRSFGLEDGDLAGAPAALAAVRDFAHLTVAGWVGWPAQQAPSRGPGLPGTRRTADGVVAAAVARLLTSQRDGYREAAHHLCFPRLGWRYETHSAVLFQRGVVLDALLDAAAAGLAVPGQVLDAEVMAILRMKHRDVRGGWNYIPAVAELPPDADDLGQVLQILYRHGGADLAATCDEGIRLVLDGAGPDGSFNTWILDPRGRSPADQAIRAYVGVVDRIVTGGWGVHPEVVANLLYGLLLYDPVRYRDPLRRASAYLLAMQQESGAWPSKWYAGPYYGTFCAVAVLGVLTPNSPALSRARAFLLSKQHADGSWGEEGGDPLSTGLALLALCRGCFSRVPGTDTAVERGADYLARTQEADGGWPAVTWLSFLSLDGPIASGSRTITTAFCLKALLAVWSTR